MRLKGRQVRFLAGTLAAWTGVRAAALMWPVAELPLAVIRAVADGSRAQAETLSSTGAAILRPAAGHVPGQEPLAVARDAQPADPIVEATTGAGPSGLADPAIVPASYVRTVVTPSSAPATSVPAPVAPRSGGSRWAGEAALFVRPGSGSAALAAGGQLGGSQAYARLTYRLNPDGPTRFAVAARVYRPLASKGAEAAFGLDWHPLPAIPLRFSIERRAALDRLGRNAWSAYAAGGFYKGHLPLGTEADGYAQAGVVGVERRDGFIDGALRIGRRVGTGPDKLLVGAGLWGAAQPGVSRLDIGPRASLTVPVAGHSLVFALEDRMRIAGQAHPGSGVAFTVAAAF